MTFSGLLNALDGVIATEDRWIDGGRKNMVIKPGDEWWLLWFLMVIDLLMVVIIFRMLMIITYYNHKW